MRSVESIAAAKSRIETFETTNAQLIEGAAQEALNIERDAPISWPTIHSSNDCERFAMNFPERSWLVSTILL